MSNVREIIIRYIIFMVITNLVDGIVWFGLSIIKAIARDRTADLLITNQLLYQLSYDGLSNRYNLINVDKNTTEIL